MAKIGNPMIIKLKIVFIAFLLNFAFPACAKDSPDTKISLGSFSTGSLNGWQSKEFKGKTDYHIVQLDGLNVLKAESKNSASGFFYEQKVDLDKTPMLNWSWRIDNRLTNANELTKNGDDFVARVYVVVSGGLIFWNTKAINYVWSSQLPANTSWPNPFAGDHAIMFAVRSGQDKIGTWYTEKRNVRNDLKQLIGKDIRFIDAVALMTDTDNTQGQATAYYGDIYFTAD